MAAYLSARQAADLCGVSERTIRNWIAGGKLSAEKSAGTFRIDREQLAATAPVNVQTSAGAERKGAESADIPQTTPRTPPQSGRPCSGWCTWSHNSGDVVRKAEATAMWQARAEFLAGQLEQAQLALAAPKEPASSGRPFLGDSEGVSVKPTQTPAFAARGRPWWRFWRA